MPISPMPPSAMNTSSSRLPPGTPDTPEGMGCSAISARFLWRFRARRSYQGHIAECHGAPLSVTIADNEGPVRVETGEGTLDPLPAGVDRAHLAHRAGALKPGAAHAVEIAPPVP